jgi:hypothetical protein
MMHFERPKMYQVWIMTRTLPVFDQIHITFSMIIVCHLTFSWIVLNVVTISRDLTRVKYTFKNLRWVSYFSRSVINRIYFPWFVISKRYISWTVTRRLSIIYLCVLVNVSEQTTSEISCTRGTVMDYLHETSLICVIVLERDIMASLLPLATHMQKTIILILSIW